MDGPTARETERVFEIWREALQRSGGPFLFGRFTIADCMYYPMLTRFITYRIEIPVALQRYVLMMNEAPAVKALVETARTAPRVPVYDEYLGRFGGDPDAGLTSSSRHA